MEEQDKIFTAFYQISDSLPTDNIGTGLGLLLVKRYANLMDCEVRVESGKETDVSFIVDFRASEERLAGEIPNATQPIGMTETVSGGENEQESRLETETGRARLLVVDDNSDMLEFLSGIFAPEYEVAVAPDVAHASSLLASSSPDLIISDVMMPGVDGMEFCRRLKTDLSTSHIPVILLTAKVDTSDCVEGLESGADIYITKPFSPDVIKSQVRSLLRNREIMRKKFMKHPETISETLPEKSVDRQFFEKVREVVEKRISDAGFTVDALAADVAVSRTGLFAKIKAVTGMTPNDYIRKIRLQKAAALLSGTGMRVNEVCWEVGFSSRSHFAKCFHEEYGMSPSEYKTASVAEAVVRPAVQTEGAGKDLNR